MLAVHSYNSWFALALNDLNIVGIEMDAGPYTGLRSKFPLHRAHYGILYSHFCSCFSIWRKSHRSQITLSAEGISYNIARQVKLTPDAFGSLRHVRRILQVAAFEKCPQARKKD